MINCILLALLLLVFMVLLKFSSSDTFPKLLSIVFSIATFNYDLARFFWDFISPVVLDDYSCKDIFSFISQIKNANLSGKFLVSYDVTRLFTNILLQKTILRNHFMKPF